MGQWLHTSEENGCNTQASRHSSVREEKVFSDRQGLKKSISDELILTKPLEDVLHPKEKGMASRKGVSTEGGETEKNSREAGRGAPGWPLSSRSGGQVARNGPGRRKAPRGMRSDRRRQGGPGRAGSPAQGPGEVHRDTGPAPKAESVCVLAAASGLALLGCRTLRRALLTSFSPAPFHLYYNFIFLGEGLKFIF